MNKLLLSLMLSGIAFSTSGVMAADSTDGMSQSMAVGRIICEKRYVSHVPVSGVTYESGVDVDGNPVVSADVSPLAASVPDYIEVPLTYDLSQSFGVAMDDAGEMKAVVGNLKLFKDGRVEYNGQDITAKASEFCGTTLVENPVEPIPYRVPDSPKEPVAGSVASSTTIDAPAPKPAFELPKGVSNMNR